MGGESLWASAESTAAAIPHPGMLFSLRAERAFGSPYKHCMYERGRGTDTNKQTFPGCVLYTRMYVERGRGSFPFVSSPLQRK